MTELTFIITITELVLAAVFAGSAAWAGFLLNRRDRLRRTS